MSNATGHTPEDRIAELLDRAVRAVNDGDLAGAHELASKVLDEDASNPDAEDLLSTDELPAGEVRRLTLVSCDLVGSTELSERLDPERYRSVVGRYRRMAADIIETRYDGHIVSTQGDGLMALFGYPTAHEDSASLAVRAALDVCEGVRRLSEELASAGGAITARAAAHRGLVYLDLEDDDIYGLAANLTARLEGLAPPGTVVISDELRQLVGERFDLEPLPAAAVKGINRPLQPFRVLGERRPGSHRHRAGAPLVGRHRELAVLRAAWNDAVAARGTQPATVLIRGEPGLGKSRLVWELAEEVRADGADVLELAGSGFHGPAALHPVRQLIEARAGIGRDDTAAERLARLRAETGARDGAEDLALLAPVLGIPPEAGYAPVPMEGRKLHEAVQAAVTRYLLGSFAGGAGLLVAEDAHWFDDSTAEVLATFIRTGPPHVMVALTARAAPPSRVHATSIIDLEPLTSAESAELVASLDLHGLSPTQLETVIDRADGVPLFLEVLVPIANEQGSLDPTPAPVPDVLYEPLVARLSPATQSLAAAVAIVGREADREVLAAAVVTAPDQLDVELASLVESNVLTLVEGGAAGGDRYRFRHELLREAVAELLPPSRRVQVHTRVADLLRHRMAEGDPGDWLAFASHFEHAGRADEAITAYLRAADQARLQGALAHARSHLGRAIALVDRLPGGRSRVEQEVDLRLRRGFIAMSTEGAGSEQAATDFARCLELAMVDTRSDEMLSTLISLWAYHLARGDLMRCRQVLDTLRASLTEDRGRLLTINDGGRAMLSWFEGDTAGARALLEKAIAELPDAPGDIGQVWFVPNDAVSAMHTHFALAHGLAGDTAAAEVALRQSDALTATLPFPQGPWSRAYRMWLGSWLLAERGRHDDALELARDLAALAEQSGFDTWTMIAMTQHAAVSALSRSDQAMVHAATLDAYLDLWEAAGLRIFLPYYLTAAAQALLFAGDQSAARTRCRAAQALAGRTGMRFYEPETTRILALASDDEAMAVLGLHDALALARRQGAGLFELRIALDLADRGAGHDPLRAALAGFPADASSSDLDRARRLTG